MFLIFIIGITVYISNKNSDVEFSNENITVTEENKVYITQDSTISPTGKEFIGIFSDNLKETYEKALIDGMENKIYNTSIENMKQFSQESWGNNLATKNINKVMETTYYYNNDNNHIIGSKFGTSCFLQITTETLPNYNMTLNDYLVSISDSSFSVFFNFHNDNESQEILDKYNKYNEYIKTIENVNKNNFEYQDYQIQYWNIGDILYISTNKKNDSNFFEFLQLAYDEKTNAEEVIKKWYSEVFTTEAISKNNSNNTENNFNNNELDNNNTDELEEKIYFPSFVEGFPIQQYTSQIEELGLKYEVEKVVDYNYDDNVVVGIEPNFPGEIPKETVIKLKVTDNVYDINVNADVRKLMLLAGIDINQYSGYFDSSINDFVEPEVQLTIKMKNSVIFDGKVGISNSTDTLGMIKGKKTDEFNIEVTIEGIKIQQTIPYLCQCSTNYSFLTVGGEGS